jgi:hypothetical protein
LIPQRQQSGAGAASPRAGRNRVEIGARHFGPSEPRT